MSKATRQQKAQHAACSDMAPCQVCGKARWFHFLAASYRRDDGHEFVSRRASLRRVTRSHGSGGA